MKVRTFVEIVVEAPDMGQAIQFAQQRADGTSQSYYYQNTRAVSMRVLKAEILDEVPNAAL